MAALKTTQARLFRWTVGLGLFLLAASWLHPAGRLWVTPLLELAALAFFCLLVALAMTVGKAQDG